MKKVININKTTIALSDLEIMGLYEISRHYDLPWKVILSDLIWSAKKLGEKNLTSFVRDHIILGLIKKGEKNGNQELHRTNH